VLACLFAIFWGYLFFGLIDLTVFLQGPEFHDSFHLETGWGLFFTFLVAAPLLAVAIAPATLPGAVQQVLLAAAALAVGAILAASPEHLLAATGIGTTALVIAAAGNSVEARAFPRRWSWGPGALVLVAAGPWFAYALTAAEAGRAGRHRSLTWGLDHWPVQTSLAVALVLVAALVATYPPGWAVAAWSVAACAVWLGAVSWIYPDLDASLGRTWGAAAIAWGLVFVAVTHLTAAKHRKSSTSGRNKAVTNSQPTSPASSRRRRQVPQGNR
jgi:hypothetical protein